MKSKKFYQKIKYQHLLKSVRLLNATSLSHRVRQISLPIGTSFFQALNISTKIEKGQIEIEKPIKIITKGQIVGNSEFELLKKLNIVPFSYEIQIILIYDNKFSYDPVVLEISEENIIETIESVYGSISSVSKVIYYPTLDSLNFTLKKTIANIYTVCRFFRH